MSTEFINGFKVYNNENDLDFTNILTKGDNFLVKNDYGGFEQYNIRIDYAMLMQQEMMKFVSYGVKIERVNKNNDKNKGNENNGIIMTPTGKVIMYISVPERNEEFGIEGLQLAKWFTWKIAKLKMISMGKDENGGSLGDILRIINTEYVWENNNDNGVKIKKIKEAIARQSNENGEFEYVYEDKSLDKIIDDMYGISDERVKRWIEVRSKVRVGEIWSKEDRINYLIGHEIEKNVLRRMEEIYGKEGFRNIVNEINEYGKWLKSKGFKWNVFDLKKVKDEIWEKIESGESENRENGGDENDNSLIRITMEEILKSNELGGEVNMNEWSKEDFEMFRRMCKRMDEITEDIIGMSLE